MLFVIRQLIWLYVKRYGVALSLRDGLLVKKIEILNDIDKCEVGSYFYSEKSIFNAL